MAGINLGKTIMPKMHIAVAGKGGWSGWIEPKRKNYRLGCCDCGLVHDFDIQIAKVLKRTKGDHVQFALIRPKGLTIVFRARRNERSTAQKRRNPKHRKYNPQRPP